MAHTFEQRGMTLNCTVCLATVGDDRHREMVPEECADIPMLCDGRKQSTGGHYMIMPNVPHCMHCKRKRDDINWEC